MKGTLAAGERGGYNGVFGGYNPTGWVNYGLSTAHILTAYFSTFIVIL
jgi:hypothetical protein